MVAGCPRGSMHREVTASQKVLVLAHGAILDAFMLYWLLCHLTLPPT